MVIVACANERFAMPMAVTFFSALVNLRKTRTVHLYVIDGGINEDTREKVTRLLNVSAVEVQLKWVRPDLETLAGLRPPEHFSRATYLRLLIPGLLPRDCDKAIYLDSDLVVERDLTELWEQDVEDFPALAVQNYGSPTLGCRAAQDKEFPLYGSAPDKPYCNAGVMLMNLKRWRDEKIAERALEYAITFQPKLVDQDALNVVIEGAWGLLDPKWNVQIVNVGDYVRFLRPQETEIPKVCGGLMRPPHILHFTVGKPWQFIFKGQPGHSRFFYYLQQMKWYGEIDDLDQLMEHTWKEQTEYDPWMKQLDSARQGLEEIVPQGDRFILVDAGEWGSQFVRDRSALPFLERDGSYYGPPDDDGTAIRELERLRGLGASFIAFGWPSFWWLDCYPEFHSYLRSSFPCITDNNQLVVFKLPSV